MVERVLCKHEVVGSIPSGSTRLERFAIMRNNRIPAASVSGGDGFDIVNEGSARLRASGDHRADLRKDINCLANNKSKRMCGREALFVRLLALIPTHEFC